MEQIPLPKNYKFIKEEGNYTEFVLEPCYPGYGVTIGNSLRRVLLSSLTGSAVTAVKIKGADHEFSTLPNVKEDVVDIILNLKQLNLVCHSEEPIRLTLKAKGDKKITAALIEKNDQVQVINPDLHIATLDGKNAELEIELVVNQGRGYVPIEAREDEKLEIGMIAVDAVYTPVRNVNFSVENVRVGKMTNYDKLTMQITTNGAITGREAMDKSARILVDHFSLLFKENIEQAEKFEKNAGKEQKEDIGEQLAVSEESPKSKTEDLPEQESEAAQNVDTNELIGLNLSRRSYNALIKNGITTAAQLKGLTEADLIAMQGLGAKSIKEILEVIAGL